MKKHIPVLLTILLLLIPGVVSAADLLGGNLMTGIQLNFTDDKATTASSTELLLELEKSNTQGGFHAALKGQEGGGEFTLTLDEVYIDYYGKYFDLRLGKQRAASGMAVKVNPTDYLNPKNPADPLGDPLAVEMLKVDGYLPYGLQLSGMIVPLHHPVLKVIPQNPALPIKPVAPELANLELALALKAMGVLGGDFSISYFRGFEDLPSMRPTPAGPEGYYRDLQALGLSLAYPLGDVGFWFEGAYFIPELTVEKGYLQTVVGGDYRLDNGLYLMGQFIYREDQKENQNMLIQLATEQTFREIHKLRLGSMYDFTGGGYAVLPELEMSLSDNLAFVLTANVTGGESPLNSGTNSLTGQLKFNF